MQNDHHPYPVKIPPPGIWKWAGRAVLIAASVALIPVAARLGLMILGIEPNPRHPPEEVWGQAVSWAIFGAGMGAIGGIIGDALATHSDKKVWGLGASLLIGAAIAIALAALLGAAQAILPRGTAQGQAITSDEIGVFAGAVVGALSGLAGAVIGVIARRVFVELMP